jgi:hypothetical protein
VGGAVDIAPSSAGGSGSSPMLTSPSEVDRRLRRMNETFLASLEGLGSSGRGSSGSGSGGSSRRRDRDQERERDQDGERERQRTRGRHEDDHESLSSGREYMNSGRRAATDGGGYNGAYRERESPRGRLASFTGVDLGRPRPGSTSTNASEGVSQGSEEVIGRLELGDERRRSRQ